jgi:hypothetical protein
MEEIYNDIHHPHNDGHIIVQQDDPPDNIIVPEQINDDPMDIDPMDIDPMDIDQIVDDRIQYLNDLPPPYDAHHEQINDDPMDIDQIVDDRIQYLNDLPPPYDAHHEQINDDPMDIDQIVDDRIQPEEPNIITINFVDPNGELVNINIPFPDLNIARAEVAAKNVIYNYIQDNQRLYPELARNLSYYVLDRCEFNRIDDRNYILHSRENVLVDRDPPVAHQGDKKHELDGNRPYNGAKRRKRGGSKFRKSKRKKSKRRKSKKKRRNKTKRR